jgi:hypothetical protein
MGRKTDGNIGTILALEGAETQTTLSLFLKDGSTRHYATKDLTAGGYTFDRPLIKADELVQTIGAAANRVPALLDNIDTAAGLDLAGEQISKATAVLGRHYSGNGLEAFVEIYRGEAIPGEANETEVALEILSDLTAAGYCVANWALMPSCQFRFKDEFCGYTGAKTTCSKTRKGPNGCQEHDAETDDYKFGGLEYPDIQPAEPPTPTPPDGGPSGPCFPAGTLILMADFSQKRIEQIVDGDFVMSFDDDWKLVPGRVRGGLQIHKGIDRLLDVDRGAITPTANHGFYTPEMERREIRTFRPGDKLRRMRGDSWTRTAWIDWTIDSRAWIDLREGIDVYNFEVEKYHRYIANRFAVSNSKLPTDIE